MGKESETESFNPLSADEQLDLFNQMSAVLRRGGLRGLQLGKGEVENVYRMRATILQLNESVAWSQRSVAAYEKDKAELQSALAAATAECERLVKSNLFYEQLAEACHGEVVALQSQFAAMGCVYSGSDD